MANRHKLKNSLIIRLIGVCIIIAASFVGVVSLIVRAQNAKISKEFIEKSYRVVFDDILSRRDKLLKDTCHFAEQKAVGTTVNFVADYKNKPSSTLYFTQDSYRRLAESANHLSQGSGLWKLMIYDDEGDLVSFYRSDPKGGHYGYVLGYPKPVLVVSMIGGSGDGTENTWLRQDIQGETIHLAGNLPGEPFHAFAVVDNTLCMVAYAPIWLSAYDQATESTLRKQVGVVVSMLALDGTFESRLSSLTGTTVNVITQKEFVDNGWRNEPPWPKKANGEVNLDMASVFFHETEQNGDQFFEGIFPVFGGGETMSLISVMYSKAFAHENTRQMITYMLVVSLCGIILVFPITVFFSNRIMAPIEALAKTARAIQEGDFDKRAIIFKNDEIGELAAVFNGMTDKLRSSLSDLFQERETLRKYERIVSTTQDIMALINRDYMLEAVNDSFLNFFHKTRETVVGFTVPEIMGEGVFREKIRFRIDEALAGQTVHRREQLEFNIGTRKLMDVSYFPFFDHNGQVQSVVLNARDITETRKLEEQLIQSQKIESIGTLAGGVAHEINNPINGIMNYAQLIFDQAREETAEKQFALEILHETQRVAGIVRNLLTFARNENQSHSPALVSDIITSVLSLVQTVMRHDQISLIVRVPDDLPKIKCRSQQIQQVIMNLMTNARDALNDRYSDYSPDKRLEVTAEELWKRDKRYVRITVADTGNGIPFEIQDKIFDPFFTTKPKEKGTGLGLSISYGIVRDHGGELSLESEPGRHTRFHVDLPVNNGWSLSKTEGVADG